MKWIEITESQPFESEIVLFWATKTKHALMAVYEKGNFYRYCDLSDTDRIVRAHYLNVTHWMPLPKFPNQ